MAQRSRIKIKYVNATRELNHQVVIFAKGQSMISRHFVAWKVMKTETCEEFYYPMTAEVAAMYEHEDLSVMCGPFKADEGSMWHISQEDMASPPSLVEGIQRHSF